MWVRESDWDWGWDGDGDGDGDGDWDWDCNCDCDYARLPTWGGRDGMEAVLEAALQSLSSDRRWADAAGRHGWGCDERAARWWRRQQH